MFGHPASGCCDYKGRGGGYVETVRPIATGADDIQQRRDGICRRHPNGVGAHRARAAGDFVHSFAFHAQRDQISAYLRRGGIARHDLVHHRFGFGLSQALMIQQFEERVCQHVVLLDGSPLSVPSERKLRSSVLPLSVRMLSGWNCTP